MPKLYLVGLGLYPHWLTIRGFEVLMSAPRVYLDGYTSPIPNEVLDFLRRDLGKDVVILKREDVECSNAEVLFEELKSGRDVVLAVMGDPLMATTHAALIVVAKRRGFEVEVVPGVSVVCAALTLSCLSPYKLGGVATVTYPRGGVLSRRPYDLVRENLKKGFHTLLLLDVSDDGKFMSVGEAIEILIKLEQEVGEGVFTCDREVIALARLGYPDSTVKYGSICDISRVDLGPPPHAILVPSSLSPVERECLELLRKPYCTSTTDFNACPTSGTTV